MTHEELLKFAQALLAENTELRKLVTAEREICAKACEEVANSHPVGSYERWQAQDCAKAIRERGEK